MDKYEEFQELYYKEYGERISREEAIEKGDRLLRLYRSVLKRDGGCGQTEGVVRRQDE